MSQVLERRTFSTSRAADFLEQRALVSQTGQPERRFGDVVLKELLDNALDASEAAGAVPCAIEVTTRAGEDVQTVTVSDSGAGIPPAVVERILDFTTLTSDKALYRSPCRGAQGNALKTIIGIPRALGVADPVIIEARGVRHVVAVSLDAAGNVSVRHDQERSGRGSGTAVTVPLPPDLHVDAARWVRGYALVNPHRKPFDEDSTETDCDPDGRGRVRPARDGLMPPRRRSWKRPQHRAEVIGS